MRLNQRTRILGAIVLATGALVGGSVLEYLTMRRFLEAGREIRAARDGRAHARAVIPALDQGWANGWAWALTQDPTFNGLRSDAVRRLLPRLVHLRQTVRDSGLGADLDRLAARVRGLELALARESAASLPALGQAIMADASGVLHRTEDHFTRREQDGERVTEQLAERAATIALTAAMLAIAISLAAGYYFESDVRRRLAAEEALHESEAHFRRVVGVLAEGVVHIDRAGVVVGCNRAATEILGLSAEQILTLGSRPFFGYAADGTRLERQDHPALVAARTGRAQRDCIWGFDTRQGERRWLQFNTEPLVDDMGRMSGVVSTFSDITARLAAEAALRSANQALLQARDDAEKASRAKSDFLANMSHELRTPLNSVIGFANVLRGNKLGNLLPDQLTYVERIHDNGRHLLSLINDVLDLSKVEAGHLELHVEEVALGPLVCQVLAQLEGQLKSRDIELLSDLRADLLPVRADRRKLQQVLINLVSNAIKFTDEGSITVRVIAGEAGRPLRLDVVDTGIGIPEDRQQSVFEPFKQADSSTSRRYGGTGLGLSISRSLLELMGYHVTLASVPGKGSTFSVHFHARGAEADTGPGEVRRAA